MPHSHEPTDNEPQNDRELVIMVLLALLCIASLIIGWFMVFKPI